MKGSTRYQAAIIRDHCMLMLKVWDHAISDGTFWVIPGGGRHQNESEAECVAREVREEAHVEVKVGRMILCEPDEGDHSGNLAKTFLCTIANGDPQPGTEPEFDTKHKSTIKEIGWFDLRDASKWDQLAHADAITKSKLSRIQEVLGYAS